MSEQTLPTLDASEEAFFEADAASEVSESTEQVEAVTESQETPQEGEKQPQKTVPLAALHEERAKAKEMRQKLAQLEEQTRVGNERMNQLMQGLQQRQQPQLPDVNTDPIVNFDTRLQQHEQALQEQRQFIAQQQQMTQQAQQYQQLRGFVQNEAAKFAQEKPDFMDAVKHVQKADMKALLAIGHDEYTAAQMVQAHHDQLVMQLAQQGVNIPERIYALAQARGYTPEQQNNGQTRIASAQKGVAASKSLGNGGATTANLTLEALANMPASEFAELAKDEKVWRRLMGG